MRVPKFIQVRTRPSRATVISSAISITRLIENVSEAVNFSPTNGAAKIVLQVLEALKEVDENDETRNRLMKRISGVVDLLHVLRRRSEVGNGLIPDDLVGKMTEIESVLNSLHETLKPDTFLPNNFWRRALIRDRIKSELAVHLNSLNEVLDGFKTWLLLDTRVAIHGLTLESQAPPSNSLHTSQCSCVTEDEMWLALCSEYDVVRLCDIELESEVQASVGCLSNFYHAEVKGKKRLVKSFDGNDNEQVKEWLKEIQYWHQFRHPNLLQMQGFTKRTSNPHIYVIFQNAQARCLATYILDALTKSDAHSIATMLVKMTNEATSAMKHAARQLQMNDVTSILVINAAALTLDSGDRLILSLYPLSPGSRKAEIRSLTHTIQSLLWPPGGSGDADGYFTRLSANTNHISGISTISTKSDKNRKAVNALLYGHFKHDESGKFYPRPTSHPMSTAPVIYSSEIKPGDYGVMVPGPKEEFSFQACGNAIDDSPGLAFYGEYSALWNNMLRVYFERVQNSPPTWCLDFNETRSKGFSDVVVRWEEKIQELTDVPRVMQHLINSIALRSWPLVNSFEEIVLVSEVHYFKDYRFSMPNLESNEQVSDATNPQTASEASRPLPLVYATQSDPQKEELVFSQNPPHFRSGPTSSECRAWDDRVQYKGKDRENKNFRYIRLRKEDIVERFGSVPPVGQKERMIRSAGPVIRSNRWWRLFRWREFEMVLQPVEPVREAKAFLKEHP